MEGGHAECLICIEPLVTDVVATNCGHPYHKDCIRRALTTSRVAKCPCCRGEVTTLVPLKFTLLDQFKELALAKPPEPRVRTSARERVRTALLRSKLRECLQLRDRAVEKYNKVRDALNDKREESMQFMQKRQLLLERTTVAQQETQTYLRHKQHVEATAEYITIAEKFMELLQQQVEDQLVILQSDLVKSQSRRFDLLAQTPLDSPWLDALLDTVRRRVWGVSQLGGGSSSSQPPPADVATKTISTWVLAIWLSHAAAAARDHVQRLKAQIAQHRDELDRTERDLHARRENLKESLHQVEQARTTATLTAQRSQLLRRRLTSALDEIRRHETDHLLQRVMSGLGSGIRTEAEASALETVLSILDPSDAKTETLTNQPSSRAAAETKSIDDETSEPLVAREDYEEGPASKRLALDEQTGFKIARMGSNESFGVDLDVLNGTQGSKSSSSSSSSSSANDSSRSNFDSFHTQGSITTRTNTTTAHDDDEEGDDMDALDELVGMLGDDN